MVSMTCGFSEEAILIHFFVVEKEMENINVFFKSDLERSAASINNGKHKCLRV
jgi:hypothetical protein